MQNWITKKTLLDVDKNEIETFCYKIYTVDSSGKVLDEVELNSESEVVCKRIYRYFENEEVQEYVEYDPHDELLERHVYVKNEHDDVVRVEYEYIDGHKTIKEFSFTDLGYAYKAEIRNEHGDITGQEVYVLDENGEEKETIELDGDHREIERIKKEYLENGLVGAEKHYSEGRLFKEEYFEYDDNGNLTLKRHKNHADGFEVIDQYQYDERNNMLYNCSHQNGVLVFENKCGYDENNHLIFEEYFELSFWEKKIVRHERLIHELGK